jgi:hypothetical protein
MSLLDALIYGVRDVYAAGVLVTKASAINFVSGATAVYNSATGRIDVTVSGGGGGGTHNIPIVEKTASYTLTTADGIVVFTGSTPAQTQTLPASPTAGDTYTVSNESSVSVSVAASAGTTIRGGATYALPAGAALTVTKSTSAIWTTT